MIRSLPMPLRIVSFEHLPHQLGATAASLAALGALANYRYNFFNARIAPVPGPGAGLGGGLAAGVARHRRPRLVMRRFCIQARRAAGWRRSCVLLGQR